MIALGQVARLPIIFCIYLMIEVGSMTLVRMQIGNGEYGREIKKPCQTKRVRGVVEDYQQSSLRCVCFFELKRLFNR